MQSLLNLANQRSISGAGVVAQNSDPYLELSGSAADYASTADKAGLDSFTGIDIIACVAFATWTPAAANTVIGKYESLGNQRAYRLEVLGTGNLALGLSDLGTAVTTGNSGAATGFVAGTRRWIRSTWRASDGRAQFFTADSPVGTVPAVWTQQLGTDQTVALASLFDSSSPLMIGRQQTVATPNPATGKVYRVIMKSSIDGTTVADFNPAGRVGQTSWDDAYGNTWALAGAAVIRL
jgi:hypothetical protein